MKKLPVLIVSSLLLAGASILIAWTGDEASSPVASTSGVGIRPVDIPAGFGYPGDRKEFQRWADQWEIGKITRHAWDLWAGMTSATKQSWRGAYLPVWETWCGSGEAFSPEGCAASRPSSYRDYRIASQLSHGTRQTGKEIPGDTAVVSFNKFNPMMASYLAEKHKGPGIDPAYSYTSKQSLANLNANWPPGTSVAQRKVEEAPYDPGKGAAMETKNVIFVVKKQGLTPIPLWQGPNGAKLGNQLNAVPESWLTCVLLDPMKNTADLASTPPVQASALQVANMVPSTSLSCQTYLYAPLATIYHTKMDGKEAAHWNKIAPNNPDLGLVIAEKDDFAVLVGMHVNTKAIVNWTWQTFWWQPGDDTPNAFPGSKQGMTEMVKGPWRNYAMCTAWNQTQGNASKNMVVCFNPYLETSTGIADGQSSNCMSCHATATVGGTPSSLTSMNYPATYYFPLDLSFSQDQCSLSKRSKTCFSDFTRTDFSWAIPGDAQ